MLIKLNQLPLGLSIFSTTLIVNPSSLSILNLSKYTILMLFLDNKWRPKSRIPCSKVSGFGSVVFARDLGVCSLLKSRIRFPLVAFLGDLIPRVRNGCAWEVLQGLVWGACKLAQDTLLYQKKERKSDKWKPINYWFE